MLDAPELACHYAEAMNKAVMDSQCELRRSTLGHRESLEELWQVWNNCRLPNWDGHDAFPVDQESYTAAYMLIESLPLGFPRPSIGAEPDGQLTLEWYKSQTRALSVSVDPDGVLHYAGLYGPGKRYGAIAFFSSAPNELIQLVRDL